MNTSTLEIEGGKTIVHIEGAAVIDTVAEIHLIFQNAVNNHLPLILDITNITEYDSSFIQLICSLCYTLNNTGHQPLRFAQDTLPERLAEIVRLTGFHISAM